MARRYPAGLLLGFLTAARRAVAVPVGLDQEEAAYAFARQDLVSTPVVDDAGRLVGVIMVDDVVDVIREEAEEDNMHLGGVQDGDFHNAVIDAGAAWRLS